MLEEQLREVELRAQEKLQDEERRHRELVARVDREKQLQVENCAIRLVYLFIRIKITFPPTVRCQEEIQSFLNHVPRKKGSWILDMTGNLPARSITILHDQ